MRIWAILALSGSGSPGVLTRGAVPQGTFGRVRRTTRSCPMRPMPPVAPAAEHPYRALSAKPARPSALTDPPIDADLRPSSGTGTATRSYWATFFAAAIVWYVGLALIDASSPAMPLLWLAGVPVSFLAARVVDRLVFAKRALAYFSRGVVAAGALASRGQIDEAEERHRAIFRTCRGRRGLRGARAAQRRRHADPARRRHRRAADPLRDLRLRGIEAGAGHPDAHRRQDHRRCSRAWAR